MEAAKILYLEKQRRLFLEAHTKGFTNADIAKLLGASVGHINNCASCSSALLSGIQSDELIRKCGLRGYVKELAEEFGFVVIDRAAEVSEKIRAETVAALEKIQSQAEEALKELRGDGGRRMSQSKFW